MSAAIIVAVGTATAAIIGAMAGAAVAVIKALHNHEGVENRKLDHITLLVNGRFGEILIEIAQLREQWAHHTGSEADIIKAEQARARADAHKAGEDAVLVKEG